MTIRDVEAATAEITRGEGLIVVGDFNLDLEGTDGWGQDEKIAAAIATVGLEDLSCNGGHGERIGGSGRW